MENIKDVEMPEKWGHMRNLESYPNTLFEKLEKMEEMGLLDQRQVKELEVMRKEEVGISDIAYPGSEKCLKCDLRRPIMGMWVCLECYESRNS